jgi:hypothetical protein
MWAFSLSAFGPIILSEATYKATDTLNGFFAVNWTRQTYLPNDRTAYTERIVFEEKKVGVGARFLLTEKVLTEAQIGWVFDRYFYISRNLFSYMGGSSWLSPDWALTWSLKAKL